jgi:hypothetical protein
MKENDTKGIADAEMILIRRTSKCTGIDHMRNYIKRIKTKAIWDKILNTSIKAFEEFCLLRHNTLQSVETQQIFRKNVSPLSSQLKGKPNKKQHEAGKK